MRELSVAEAAHPLVDRAGTTPDGVPWVATESRAPVVHLNPMRANLMARAVGEGVRLALVTDESSCLTRALAHVWRRAGCGWVVQEPSGGQRDGFTGRILPALDGVWSPARTLSPEDISPRHRTPQRVDALQLTAIVSERHPARSSVVLGGTVQAVSETLLSRGPYAWGAHEPVAEVWHRPSLTRSLRDRMPADATVLALGEGLAATVTARRTQHGVEEVTQAYAALPGSTAPEFTAARAQLDAALGRLAVEAMPLVALVLARPGRRDLLVPPYLTEPSVPLSLLVGAPAVRTLGLDAAQLAARFDGQLVGRPRLPALLFPLGADAARAWLRLDEIVAALDPGGLEQTLGSIARMLWAERPTAAGARRAS